MAKRLAEGALPPLQKTCVADMQDWCFDKWKKIPQETSIKNRIHPFYAVMTHLEKAKSQK
ncbi:MAG: hypothetical protein ABW189_08050 [Rickettsiales bacterium]